jgi:hypothetical protein
MHMGNVFVGQSAPECTGLAVWTDLIRKELSTVLGY